jgi:uncharacterized protein YjiK
MKKILFLTIVVLIMVQCKHADAQKLKHTNVIHLKIKEPSDVALSFDKKHLYIVSDDGILVETDLQGNVLRKTTNELTDAEGVYADETYIYVADESPRLISLFDVKSFEYVKSVNVPYSGGRNKGFESITFDKVRNVFYLIVEKDPKWLITLDEQLRVISQFEIHGKGDISSATIQNGKLWLLNDEYREIMVMNIDTKQMEKRYSIDVTNPEGIAFLPDGKMIVVSDDRQLMYFFNNPENLSDAK